MIIFWSKGIGLLNTAVYVKFKHNEILKQFDT